MVVVQRKTAARTRNVKASYCLLVKEDPVMGGACEETKACCSGKSSAKLGRKGDPRMHRAVSARIANPDISLFDALRIGGFDYPTNDDASVVDSEKVTLGQRKNQLSRRLRLARKQNALKGNSDDCSVAMSVSGDMNAMGDVRTGAAARQDSSALSPGAHKELQKLMQHSGTSTACSNNSTSARALQMKRESAELGLSDDDVVDPDATGADLTHDEHAKRPRIAKFHPDYSPLFVPPAASVRNSFSAARSGQKNPVAGPGPYGQPGPGYPPHAVGDPPAPPPVNMTAPVYPPGLGAPVGYPPASLFTQQISNVYTAHQAQQPRASAVAISSLSTSAQSVGMTLEQLAMTLASNPTSLAKMVANSNGADATMKQQELALRLYETKAKTLYTKCMLLAGIDPKLCHTNSQAHLQFAFKAWQAEGKRLQEMMGDAQLFVGEAPLTTAIEDSKKSPEEDAPRESDSCCGRAGIAPAATSPAPAAAAAPASTVPDEKGYGHDYTMQDRCPKVPNQKEGDLGCLGRHLHRLDGQCGHKAIIHQPKGGPAHIDFVVGDKVECYHGIDPIDNSAWPSRMRCDGLEDNCRRSCSKGESTDLLPDEGDIAPKIIDLADINLHDPEWNYDLNGSIDGGVLGLFKLGETPADNGY